MIVADPIQPSTAALSEAKAYLRIESAEEDGLAQRLIASATALCEQFTGRTLIARGFSQTLPASSGWQRLGATPVLAITRVETVPQEGPGALIPAAQYAVDIDAGGDGWVRVKSAESTVRIRVTYEAGLAAEWSGIPEALRQGIVRLTAHLYTQRDAASDEGPPAAVTALWRPWRRMRLR